MIIDDIKIHQPTISGEDIERFLKSLPEPTEQPVIRFSAALNRTNFIVKIGNKFTIPKDIKEGEYKIIELPEEEDFKPLPRFEIKWGRDKS